MRLFIAINFPRPVRSALLQEQEIIRSNAVRGNFSREGNLHLTLAFLGEMPSAVLPELCEIIDALDIHRFALSLDRIGRFGRDGNDTWWVGAAPNRSLESLQKRLVASLREAGFPTDAKRFTAHVTLARQVRIVETAVAQQLLRTIKPISAPVGRISLMESLRIDGTLTYVELHGHDLRENSR